MPRINCPHSVFKDTKDERAKETLFARHLIQSFLPRETSPEMAHQIGIKLYKNILKDEYEFVLSTYVDKGISTITSSSTM